jgi:hypothetical protein
VNSIRDGVTALDTNEFIFGLRDTPDYPACRILLFERLPELTIYVPLQIVIELQRNLSNDEMRGLFLALATARTVRWDYAPAPPLLVRQWEQRGAKKGDAVIAAHLEGAGVRYFVSENRHFLAELPALPFSVLTSAEAIRLLDGETTTI